MLPAIIAFGVAVAARGSICERGAGPLRALDLPGGVRITGAGSTQHRDTTWLGWTGAQCTAWISWRGPVRVADDERSVLPMPGSFLTIHADGAAAREYRVVDSAGLVIETMIDGGRAIPIGPAEREWIAEGIAEFARRAPVAPAQRAVRIYERHGLDSLFAEAVRVPREEVRAEYLIIPLLSSALPEAQRPDYIRRGAFELGTSDALAHFLLSVPSDWRRDSTVTLRVLQAASRIEPDDAAISVLRRVLPAGPLSGDIADATRSIIATLQSSEQRATLTTLYFSGK